jgi:hypothetical protein
MSEMKEKPTDEGESRSTPLKSTYNSKTITFVLVIAAIVAAILIFWPRYGS